MSGRGVIVGVDVGGTFTDLFLLDAANGTFRTAKVPSRRGDEALGFLNGLTALGGAAGMQSIVHGTTVGTNTLLERRGPKIGVIATRGFRDTLEMRRRDRRRTWGLWGDFVPIADRDMRVEVDERTLADGTVRKALEPEEVRAAAKVLVERGATALTITFIRVFHTPGHSPGSVTFVLGQDQIVGDLILPGSVGRTDIPGASWEEIEASIRKVMPLWEEETRLYTGHGPVLAAAEELRTNPYLPPGPS